MVYHIPPRFQITGTTSAVALNLALDPSCICTSLEDASSFDSCLLRSEREREQKRDPTLLNTRLASSGSQTSFSNSSFTPLPKTCFLLPLSSLPLIRPSAYLEVNSAAWKREKVFFVCLTSNPRPFEKANREKLPLLWAWRDLQTTAFSATLLALWRLVHHRSSFSPVFLHHFSVHVLVHEPDIQMIKKKRGNPGINEVARG